MDAEMTIATRLFLNKTDLDQLFAASVEVTVRIVAISVFGCGYPKYAHYHLHAPWQLLRLHLQGWRMTGEEVGEALHKLWKRLSLHTTRGGARGRRARGQASQAGADHAAASREQRVRSGDMYALHQMVRQYTTQFIATHKKGGLQWMDQMQHDHPTVKAFNIDTSGVRKRRVDTDPVAVEPSPREMLGPYDVIDRLGSDIRMAETPAAAGGRDGRGKRATTRDGAGSGNPNPRTKRREEANAAMRSARGGKSSRAAARLVDF
jgi:hypothetical protein